MTLSVVVLSNVSTHRMGFLGESRDQPWNYVCCVTTGARQVWSAGDKFPGPSAAQLSSSTATGFSAPMREQMTCSMTVSGTASSAPTGPHTHPQ